MFTLLNFVYVCFSFSVINEVLRVIKKNFIISPNVMQPSLTPKNASVCLSIMWSEFSLRISDVHSHWQSSKSLAIPAITLPLM